MELTPVRPTAKAPPSNVTGDVYVDAIFRGDEPSPMTAAVVRFRLGLPWRGAELRHGWPPAARPDRPRFPRLLGGAGAGRESWPLGSSAYRGASLLPCRPQQDLVDGQSPRTAEDERDDLGDVFGGDLGLVVSCWTPCFVSAWVMWFGSSVATTPGSTSVTRTSGSSSCRSDSDQPLMPHLVAA